jgi:hypothetical protein
VEDRQERAAPREWKPVPEFTSQTGHILM